MNSACLEDTRGSKGARLDNRLAFFAGAAAMRDFQVCSFEKWSDGPHRRGRQVLSTKARIYPQRLHFSDLLCAGLR